MTDTTSTRNLMAEAVSSVLETTCFTSVVPAESAERIHLERLAYVQVSFRGLLQGRFVMAASIEKATATAPDFLGIHSGDSRSASSVYEVLADLTNMTCWATLTRFEPNAFLHLSAPEFRPSIPLSGVSAAAYTFDPGYGSMVVQCLVYSNVDAKADDPPHHARAI